MDIHKLADLSLDNIKVKKKKKINKTSFFNL
jgi:hypothetical protein